MKPGRKVGNGIRIILCKFDGMTLTGPFGIFMLMNQAVGPLVSLTQKEAVSKE